MTRHKPQIFASIVRPSDALLWCAPVITVAHVAVVIFIIIAGFTQVRFAALNLAWL